MKKNSKKKPETFLELSSGQKNKVIKKAIRNANIEQKKTVELAISSAT